MKLKNRYVILVLLLFISIGFAVLTSNLSINGTASFTDASFNVHFENAKVEDKNIDDGTITINNDTVTITSTGTFDAPGDYINTSFYVVNAGTMDAQLDTFSVSGLTTQLSNYFACTVKYDVGGANVARGDILRAGQGRKINMHIEYKYNIEELSSISNLSITITMNYINPKISSSSTVWNYEYTGGEQYFIANKTGNYKLEVWGAQGGSFEYEGTDYLGGYGGYSTGIINLNKNEKIYLNVGGMGTLCLNSNKLGGYNGGGDCSFYPNSNAIHLYSSGGGATHFSKVSGLLSTLESHKGILVDNSYYSSNDIIIVAAGGGGSGIYESSANNEVLSGLGGHGGGYLGVNDYNIITIGDNNWINSVKPTGATQISGGTALYNINSQYVVGNDGSFGSGGGKNTTVSTAACGGGGGFYGGSGNRMIGGTGGSGYIGNPSLTNKIMYCYNCQSSENESDETHIKTRSTTNVSDTATSNYAKIGNGFARITYIGN